jgi:cyclase
MKTLRPRIVISLLISNGGIVKTTNFNNPVYIGDPMNIVRIFNEKKVDELFVVDIDATRKKQMPNYKLIEKMAKESSMPLCFGGGIDEPGQAEKIISLGVEKISISSAAVNNSKILSLISKKIGSQSTVVVIDVKLVDGIYYVWTENGLKDSSKTLTDVLNELSGEDFGELVINSIDRDGSMLGYDLNLADFTNSNISVPVSILGGAGKFEHIIELVKRCGVIGAASGSMYVFNGKYRAVLPSYISSHQRQQIYNSVSSK